MASRDFKGIWISKEIWLNQDLTLQEKVFLVEISSLDNENGCYANNRYFAEFFGISITRVSEVINSLVEKGLIQAFVKVDEGNKRILKTLLNFPLRPSQTKVEDPLKESFKHNNTISNTDNNPKNNIGADKSASCEDRALIFRDKVAEHLPKYKKEMLREFYDYWTEKNDGGRKMRFEMQKVFDIAKRLNTWKNNETKKGYGKGTNTNQNHINNLIQGIAERHSAKTDY